MCVWECVCRGLLRSWHILQNLIWYTSTSYLQWFSRLCEDCEEVKKVVMEISARSLDEDHSSDFGLRISAVTHVNNNTRFNWTIKMEPIWGSYVGDTEQKRLCSLFSLCSWRSDEDEEDEEDEAASSSAFWSPLDFQSSDFLPAYGVLTLHERHTGQNSLQIYW